MTSLHRARKSTIFDYQQYGFNLNVHMTFEWDNGWERTDWEIFNDIADVSGELDHVFIEQVNSLGKIEKMSILDDITNRAYEGI